MDLCVFDFMRHDWTLASVLCFCQQWRGRQSSTPGNAHCWGVYISATPLRVQCCLTFVIKFAFLLNTFSCAYWSKSFLNWAIFLLLICRCSLYNLGKRPLSELHIVNLSPVWFSFRKPVSFLTVSCDTENFYFRNTDWEAVMVWTSLTDSQSRGKH